MRAFALVALAAVLGTACADDGGDGAVVTTAPPERVDCGDCRTVAAGNAFQDGETAVGVSRCDAASCEVVIAAPDGTETELDVAPGDPLDAGVGWLVVATGSDGLTIRPG